MSCLAQLILAPFLHTPYHVVGIVVRVSATRAEDPRFDSRLRCGDLSESRHTSDTPGAWRYRVSAGTGWPDVSILIYSAELPSMQQVL